jgi:tRNA G46 methylase TrmB
MLLELAERALAPNGRLSVAADADEYKAHVERVSFVRRAARVDAGRRTVREIRE